MRALLVAVAVLASGCYAGMSKGFAPETLDREPGWASVRGVPMVSQREEKDCGAAAGAMVLGYWGQSSSSATVWADAQPDGVGKAGIRAGWLRDYLRGKGLTAYLIHGTLTDLYTEVARGNPVLVGMVKKAGNNQLTHYEVVVAFHAERRTVVTLDPARGWRQSDADTFLREWEGSKFLMIAAAGAPRP